MFNSSEGNKELFNCQFYITGKQIFKIQRCFGKVDVIITDSPIPTGIQYTDSESLKLAILDEFKRYKDNNINVYLNRAEYAYNENGRNQSEEESKMIDNSIEKWMNKYNIPCIYIDVNEQNYEKLLEIIIKKIKKNE